MGDADVAAIGALLGDPGRCRMLLALGDGRALPASHLASEAGVAPSTASGHLAKLVAQGLVAVEPKGRYRYYRLAGPEVGELIEVLARLAPPRQVRSLREGTQAFQVRRARTCYDHLAGRLGVAVTEAMLARGWLDGGGDGGAFWLTPGGRDALTGLGVAMPDADGVRCCLDWTEKRHHMAGPHGRALLQMLLERDWVRRAKQGRAVLVTDAGSDGLRSEFGVTLPD